ncbi:hypothetical protein GCM10023085_45380 [Actinomadura viridis]|uniref:Phage-related protein n=1 Tax=Actinomadura viridis TaxID=58110 RepID=A0A931GJM3_9ACTN|nr:hypothetical protein [Actinomadura viridis]MBG6089898.1 phage-related protein [Actinomadura viridis]
MVASISVGSVSVDVVPSVRDFASRVRAQILPDASRIGREAGKRIQEGIEKEIKPVRIRVDMGQALARLTRLKKALEEIDGRHVQARVTIDFGNTPAELVALEQILRRLDQRTITINVRTDADRSITSLLRLSGSATSASSSLGGLRRGILGLPLPALAAAAIGAGAGLIQLAANLAPVIGLTAALPAVIGGTVAAVGTLKLALSGVGDAFKAALGEDAEKFEKSLEGLSPAAQAAARELRALRPELVGIRHAAQDAFFAKLTGQLRSTAQVLTGPLRAGVRGLATEYGAAARQALVFARESQSVRALNTVFGALRASVRSLVPAINPVLRGLRDMASAGTSSMERLAGGAADVATRFGQWMSNLAASGRVTQIINAGLAVVQQVGALLVDLGGVINSIFTAARAAGSGLFGVLGPMLNQLNAFLKTAAAQQAMTAFFQAVGAIGRALAPILPIIGGIVAQLLQGLHPVVMALIPLVNVLVAAFGRVVGALTPILVPLGLAIAQLAQGLLPILTPIINLIAQTAVEIGGALVSALVASLPALQQIVLAVASLLPALTPILPMFSQLVLAIAPVIPPLVQLVAVLVGYLVPVLRLAITIVMRYWQVVVGLLLPVFRLMVSVVTWVSSVIQPIFHGIWVALQTVGRWAQWLWSNAIAPAFRGIATVARWLYSFIAVVLIAPLILQFKIVAGIVKWLWSSVIAPAFRGIATVIRWAYNTFIRPVLNMFVTVMRTYVAPAVRWLYNTIIRPVWNAIGSSIRYVWNTFIRPTFDGIKSAVGKLGRAFKVGVDAIRKAWDKLKDAAKAPVSFVVNTVFNKGIVGVWNAVAALVPGVGRLDPIRGFNTGGIYPGYTPGRDIGLIGVSGGEAIMRPEWTRAVGPGFVDAANAAARRGGVGAAARFMTGAFGGNFFLGGVVDKFKNAAKGLFADGLKKSAQRVFGPLLALSDKTTGGMGAFGKLVSAIPHALISKIMTYFGPLEAKIGGDAKGVVAAARRYIGVGDDRGMDNNNRFTRQWGWPAGTPWCALFVSTAVKDAKAGKFYPGYPTAAVATFNARMKHISTSAGRPGDLATYGSNSHVNLIEKPLGGSTYRTIGGNEGPRVKRGTRSNPATVLRPGFALGGVIDPKVFGQRNFDPADRTAPLTSMYRELAKGTLTFDSGGWLPTGTSLVYNGTGAPEPVFTDAQWSKLSGSTRGGDGPRIGTLMNVEHQHIHDTVDVDSVAQRLDFAARASTFGE